MLKNISNSYSPIMIRVIQNSHFCLFLKVVIYAGEYGLEKGVTETTG